MVVDEGHELASAVQRAAKAQGVNPHRLACSVDTLRRAIDDYRELFRPQQVRELAEQRGRAVEAMRTFAEFEPRLAGALVHGDGPLDRIRLLLLADTPEQVIHRLSDLHIPWREAEVTLPYSRGRHIAHPALRFVAGQSRVELVVLDPGRRSDPPRDPLTDGPLTLLDIDQVRDLIDDA